MLLRTSHTIFVSKTTESVSPMKQVQKACIAPSADMVSVVMPAPDSS